MLGALALAAALFGVFFAGHLLVLALVTRPASPHALLASMRFALEFIAGEALMLTLALSSGALRLAPFSLLETALTLSASVVWWELWFYAGHRLLHTRWLFRFHRRHHDDTRVHASLAFSVVETALLSSGFYAPLALASHVFDAVSIPTLAIALGGAYLLNVLAHSEAHALSARMDATLVRHVFNSPRYHAQHHAWAGANFALNAPWFDRMFRTERVR